MSTDSKPPKRQFNVQLPSDLIQSIKHASIDESQTLSEFVEHLLRTGLEQRENEASHAPV